MRFMGAFFLVFSAAIAMNEQFKPELLRSYHPSPECVQKLEHLRYDAFLWKEFFYHSCTAQERAGNKSIPDPVCFIAYIKQYQEYLNNTMKPLRVTAYYLVEELSKHSQQLQDVFKMSSETSQGVRWAAFKSFFVSQYLEQFFNQLSEQIYREDQQKYCLPAYHENVRHETTLPTMRSLFSQYLHE